MRLWPCAKPGSEPGLPRPAAPGARSRADPAGFLFVTMRMARGLSLYRISASSRQLLRPGKVVEIRIESQPRVLVETRFPLASTRKA